MRLPPPFEYFMGFQYVYIDGMILDQSVIEITMEDIVSKFQGFCGYLTAASIGANIPNTLSVPNFIAHGLKNLLAIFSESGYQSKSLDYPMVENCITNLLINNPKEQAPTIVIKETEKEEDLESSTDSEMERMFDDLFN